MKTLKLLYNKDKKRVYYVASRQDYELLCSLKVPLRKVTEDLLPLLQSRCSKQKIQLLTKHFVYIEDRAYQKIQEQWPQVSITRAANKTFLEVLSKKKLMVNKAQKLAEALSRFYERHMYKVEINYGRKSKTHHIILTMELDYDKEPEWKDDKE